jgi:DNA-binding SARP family transcriptional activator
MSDVLQRAGREIPAPADQNTVVRLESPPRQHLVRIHLLGSMRATTYVGENILPRGRKTRALLGYLCLNAGERVSRSRLCSMLWERVTDRQARNSLRQALHELSRAMGPLAAELISAEIDTVRLEPRLCWTDALALLSSEPLPPQSFRSDLASLCTGELLEDLSGTAPAFDQWLLVERTRFTSRLRVIFESEMEQLGDASPSRRAALARNVIAFDPTHEGASRILMRALSDMGERAQAIREYERCREALKTALDVEPSSETRTLWHAVKTFSGPKNLDNASAVILLSNQAHALEVNSPPCSRLRVGVLPLEASASLGNERLAFSLSQEIAAALARFRWFDVITPMTLIDSPPASTSRNLLRSKKLHYLVEGDLSGTEQKFQISVRLLDVLQDARCVWSDRLELTVDALDRVNELIIAPIVARIDPVILFIEGQQKQLQRSGATNLVLQAMPLLYSLRRDKYEEAGRLISCALEADPENAKAAAWGAHWQVFHVGQGWSADPQRAFETAQELALRAIRIDPENAEALGIYGHICAFLDKDYESALHYFDRSLRLNPNLAFVWALSAATHCYIGEPDIALQRLDRCRDLAPFDPYFSLWECMYTIAYTFKGDYEKAVSVGRRAVTANSLFSNGYKPLIASLGHLGRRDEAAPYIEKLLTLEPAFTAEKFGKAYPIKHASDRDRYMKGLVLAGVPEA